MAISNPKKKFWFCNTCGASFTSNVGLYYHMPNHTGKWKFVCEMCSKGYMEAAKYRKHVESHKRQLGFSA